MDNGTSSQPADRFAGIFKAFMIFCVLVWMWGLGLFMLWPWQQGGEWLPDFPIVAICQDESLCAVPYGELAAAQNDGRVTSLVPPESNGETAYELINIQWKKIQGGIEAKVSAWNFQTTVRYRIENGMPVLLSYQEISAKVFLFAIGGALVSLLIILLRKRRR